MQNAFRVCAVHLQALSRLKDGPLGWHVDDHQIAVIQKTIPEPKEGQNARKRCRVGEAFTHLYHNSQERPGNGSCQDANIPLHLLALCSR